MHPADQFERFRELADGKGWGAEEIGARFGVSASVSHHNREFSLFIDYEYIFISIPFVSALTTIVTLCYNFVNKQSERLQN